MIEVVQDALRAVARDIEVTLGETPRLEAVENPGDQSDAWAEGPGDFLDGPPPVVVHSPRVAIHFDGGCYGEVDPDDPPAAVTAEVAQMIQVDVCDNRRVWPICSEHEFGLHAVVEADTAVWRCSAGPHVVAPVGALAP